MRIKRLVRLNLIKMMNLNLNPVKSSLMCKCILFALSLFVVMPAWSSGWDAKTRLTNTAFTDLDVKAALDKGLSTAFQQAFPSSQYGVYVLIDKSNASAPTRGVVYVMMGLCKRHKDGSYDLPEVTYSSMLILTSDQASQEREQLSNRLIQQASAFAAASVQNAARLR